MKGVKKSKMAAVYRSQLEINTGVFPEKMCSSGNCKNHGCGEKKPEGTSSAMFDVGTAAKCCDRVRWR